MKLSARFSEALVYAAALHADQRRKISGEPYLAHLLGVAAIALQHGAHENEAIAALLHDAIEDQGGAAAREEIRRRFGQEVAEIVEGCSDTDTIAKPPPGDNLGDDLGTVPIFAQRKWDCPLPKGSCSSAAPKPPWRRRKEAYVAHLGQASASVRLVSASDKLHNARAILLDYRLRGESLWDHFRGGRQGTLWYYRAVVDALKLAGTSPLVEELERVVCELERLASKSGEISS